MGPFGAFSRKRRLFIAFLLWFWRRADVEFETFQRLGREIQVMQYQEYDRIPTKFQERPNEIWPTRSKARRPEGTGLDVSQSE
jgi:hypothetical protein